MRVDGVPSHGKLHLDTNELRLGGARRLTIPLADIETADVVDGTLRLHSGKRVLELDLGPQRAQSWRTAIVSPKSLLEKLGVRRTERVCVRRMPDPHFGAELARTLDARPSPALRGTFDVIFLGLAAPADVDDIPRALAHLAPAGALWIVHPKGKGSPIPESPVREAVRRLGMYDAKVVAFSPTHTAMKAMLPLAARARHDERLKSGR